MREVEIARLGAKGDGVAEGSARPEFISFALPGERWRLGEGSPQRLTASAERRDPLCRHFGTCGGCVAQHMSDTLYEKWKHAAVAEAFSHRGIVADVRPLVRVPTASRRRAFFGVERRGREVLIGFREEGEHTLVDMAECPVLDPAIVAALPHLRTIARLAMPKEKSGRLVVTKLDTGLDVAFDNGIKVLSAEERAALASAAEAARLVRLTVAGDLVVQRGPATLTIAGVAVEPPPSVFLQAVPAAEAALSDIVRAAVPKKTRTVCDLFAGLGTFTFPLARRFAVIAFDSDKRAIGALDSARKKATGLKPVEARLRDLFREPMSVRELNGFDCIVFDPPRAGAAEQAERIAQSKVPVVIAVSCNPATMARDARTLIDGGYAMGPVTPIDQFVFSPHVEAVAVFSKKGGSRQP
ncbi:MAG: class I SAM-dependent RNA methyltransferase [Hyphomicrobium sp.]